MILNLESRVEKALLESGLNNMESQVWSVSHPNALFTVQFTSAYVDYAKSYCWIKNTYYIAMDESIPIETIKRENEELTYYQWVPLILLFQVSRQGRVDPIVVVLSGR